MSQYMRLPQKDELDAIDGIAGLMRSIASYVSQDNVEADHRTVLSVYGAFCEALVQEKILRYTDIPPLRFQYSGHDYIVSLSKSHYKGCLIVSQTHTSTHIEQADAVKVVADAATKVGTAKTLESRARDILRDLQAWSSNLRQETRGLKRKARELDVRDEAGTIDAVKQRLDDVAHQEEEIHRMNGLANLSYFRLGEAYRAWAREQVTSCHSAVTTREFHSSVFPRFCAEFGKLTLSPNVHRSYGLKKKLERARKFYAIGEIIGPSRLPRCQGLSVLKVDAIPMKVLDTLLHLFPEEVLALQTQE